MSVSPSPSSGSPLQHGVDGDGLVGQDAGDVGQDAGLVLDPQAQVVAGLDRAHGQDGQAGHGVRLEGQVRHPVLGIGGGQAGDVDQIGDDGGGRRLGTGALAVVEGGADGVAPDQDGVHGALDVGEEALGRNQGGMDAQLDAVGAAFGDAQQLDAVAQLFGVFDVGRFELGDALDVGLVELHRDAEGDGGNQVALWAASTPSMSKVGSASA